MPRCFAPFTIALLLVLAGCGASGANEESFNSVTGPWTGQATTQGTTYTLTMTLEQPTLTAISGAGTISTAQESFDFTISSGSFNPPTMSLQFRYEGMRPAFFSGTVSDDFTRITGTLSGPPVGTLDVELNRP